jgi:hypothetical protein
MPTPKTDLPPLPDLIAAGGTTRYGVPVCLLGEDGEDLIAAGHHPARTTTAAFLAVARWLRIPADVIHPAEARQLWATFRRPDPTLGDDPDAAWMVDWSADQDTPGAVPVTVLALD